MVISHFIPEKPCLCRLLTLGFMRNASNLGGGKEDVLYPKAYLHPRLITWALQLLIDFILTLFFWPVRGLTLNSVQKSNRARLRQETTPLPPFSSVFMGCLALPLSLSVNISMALAFETIVEPEMSVSARCLSFTRIVISFVCLPF